MKKAITILLTITTIFMIVIFVFANFYKETDGIVTRYYYTLDSNRLDNIEIVPGDNYRFNVSGLRCLLHYNDIVGVGYLYVYPFSNSNDDYIAGTPNSSNSILCYPSFAINTETGNTDLTSIKFYFDYKYIASSLTASADAFQRGTGEFTIYDSFNDNILTWVADYIVEFVHSMRIVVTFLGGNLIV